ncbi:hypothetical protein [Paraflavitalea speifideaquila]|uniref:hypothetical protein n=1 Tax=Paraflavitalea speifideaquila TaxID=3076558 RepID=UPI0028EE3710|nr:hypothetical protein [Paraflavitalea speifideiaquila]
MKTKKIAINILFTVALAIMLSACNKLLDKEPVTQIVTPEDSTTISATDAENSIAGLYRFLKSDGVEFNIFDRLTTGMWFRTMGMREATIQII